ncbi:hypothetical protein GCM10010389_36250 [Streptomyces echinoruber]|uniref:Uncharacterized protein n=1 Tax=Streptomyces echinoruber TaxID=68898 RepID=A0A918RF31_9ACTN|nr:hypothetical protein GCM10010389_36250 [Streptomyces echinoruber]
MTGAGFDPAFIPGITPPAAGDPEDAREREPEETDGRDDTTARDSAEPTGPTGPAGLADSAEPTGAADSADSADSGESGESAESVEEEAPDGPVFEAADRRARILADARGVRLRLDDQECEFRWDEIGAVETTVPRLGKRYTVTVHTPEGRWYPIEIDAPSRARIKEWESQLDEVLDAFFDDGTEEPTAKDDKGDTGDKDDSGEKGED